MGERIASLTLAAVVLLGSALQRADTMAAAVDQEITVRIDGEQVAFDQPPIIRDGYTYVPFRNIFELLGAEVAWDAETQKVTGTKESTAVELHIGGKTAYRNGEALQLHAAPLLLNGRALVPLRFVSEAMGSEVVWTVATRTVDITGAPAREIPFSEQDGVKLITAVRDGKIAVYDGVDWEGRFWKGVNLGVTTPGHYPGELSPAAADYLRWFEQMKEMNADLVRVYTILPPHFYEALEQFNRNRADPLYLMQGIYSPEEEMIGEDGLGNNAFLPAIKDRFAAEIKDAVRVVYGDAVLPAKPGQASGTYISDVSKYLVGWLVGTEWYPNAVQRTNDASRGMAPYQGQYVSAKAEASPFESWLAEMLDTLAKEETSRGWQHPIAFTNWVTTDPLEHPNEPYEEEDLVSVDPMHLTTTPAWKAGYFAAYHVYPYYPDSLRYDTKYQVYRDRAGQVNPYAGYLNELRSHHQDVPMIVAEFGVPSSRGMAHRGPLGFDQGMHSEQEQGEINSAMLRSIHEENYAGAVVFAWHDEWFKYTWNTMELTLPRDRTALWLNRLTNEANFGLIAHEPGAAAEAMIYLDGKTADWERRTEKTVAEYEDYTVSVAHDEAFLYMLLQHKSKEWTATGNRIDLGFSVLDGGSVAADRAPGVTFQRGIEFLLQWKGDDSYLSVNSAYDQHTWLYGHRLQSIPYEASYKDVGNGIFLPWKLALSAELYLPATKETIPFEEVDLGHWKRGVTDPSAPNFNSLADWYGEGNVLELRIPWMMLGVTDPSSRSVWKYPYEAGGFEPVEMIGIDIEPVLYTDGDPAPASGLIRYDWDVWNVPTYHERKKKSFDIMKNTFMELDR